MTLEYDPRAIARQDLLKFLPNMRAIRAFEQLFQKVPDQINTNTTDITEIRQYLQYNIKTVQADYGTSNSDDTILIDGSLVAVTVSLTTEALEGKIQNFPCINSDHACIIHGNGNLINGETYFQIYEGESLALQVDKDNNWWVK